MPDEVYIPKVNDYVIWHGYSSKLEGWVYFHSSEYITIEIKITPKSEESLCHCPIHRNKRVCVLCYHWDWNQLEFIKSRTSPYEETNEV